MTNLGYYHEAGFYEDGSNDVADYAGHGNSEDINKFSMEYRRYDDDFMRQAQANVDASGEFDDEDYKPIRNNCQDYCSALREEYKRLKKEQEKKKSS